MPMSNEAVFDDLLVRLKRCIALSESHSDSQPVSVFFFKLLQSMCFTFFRFTFVFYLLLETMRC